MGTYNEILEEVIEELEMQRERSLKGETPVLNVPFLLAPVGTGKSAMADYLSKEKFGIPLAKINLGENSSGVEVTGLPDLMNPGRFVDLEDEDVRFTRWSMNEIIEHAIQYPTFLFIDDADKGPRPLQAALLALTCDRTIRDRPLHPETLVMLAGNRVGDDIHAHEISESLLTRTTPLVLDYTIDDFQRYAARTGNIHPNILGFVSHSPEYVHKKPEEKTADFRFPCPRSWEEASPHLFKLDAANISESERADRAHRVIRRKLGDAVASEWSGWTEVLGKIDLPRLYKSGELDSSISTYASVAAAVMLSVESNKHAGDAPAEVPGLKYFLKDTNADVPKEAKVVCFSLLREDVRTALAVSTPDIDFTPLFEGLGLG